MELKVYFATPEVQSLPSQMQRLLVVKGEDSKDFFDCLIKIKDRLKDDETVSMEMPPRKKRGIDKKIKRRLLFYGGRNITQESIFLFHLWRIAYDIKDEKIFDSEQKTLIWLHDIAKLNENQGSIAECICAFDYRNNIFIWRDIEGVTKSDIEKFFSEFMQRKFELTYIQNPESDQDFESLNIEKLHLDVDVVDPTQAARILAADETDAENRMDIFKELQTIGVGLSGKRIRVSIFSDKNRTRGYLEKAVVEQNLPELRRLLALMNASRKPKQQKRGKLIAEGNYRGFHNEFEERVVDLFEGLLIVKREYVEADDIDKSIEPLEEAMLSCIKQGREKYEMK